MDTGESGREVGGNRGAKHHSALNRYNQVKHRWLHTNTTAFSRDANEIKRERWNAMRGGKEIETRNHDGGLHETHEREKQEKEAKKKRLGTE